MIDLFASKDTNLIISKVVFNEVTQRSENPKRQHFSKQLWSESSKKWNVIIIIIIVTIVFTYLPRNIASKSSKKWNVIIIIIIVTIIFTYLPRNVASKSTTVAEHKTSKFTNSV